MIRRIGLAFVFVMGFLILVAEVQRYEDGAAVQVSSGAHLVVEEAA